MIKAHGMVGVGFKVEVLEEERERTTSGDIEKDISQKKKGGGDDTCLFGIDHDQRLSENNFFHERGGKP